MKFTEKVNRLRSVTHSGKIMGGAFVCSTTTYGLPGMITLLFFGVVCPKMTAGLWPGGRRMCLRLTLEILNGSMPPAIPFFRYISVTKLTEITTSRLNTEGM